MRQHRSVVKHVDDSAWRVLSDAVWYLMRESGIDYTSMYEREIIVQIFRDLVVREET